MRITQYQLNTDKFAGSVTLAVVSDLHARPYKKALDAVKAISPDAILLPGDIVEIAAEYMDKRNQNGLAFLKEASSIAPCYYCYGNHEIYYSHAKGKHTKSPEKALFDKYLELIDSFGIHLINDSEDSLTLSSETGEKIFINIGGLVCGREMDPTLNCPDPDFEFLDSFSKNDSYKILLCHYPHYFDKYLKYLSIDLVLSGHAHGGQWEFFGRGIYAPHQGLFPKYTAGLHSGRHVISRGAANNVKPIPRFFNPCEVLKITVKGT